MLKILWDMKLLVKIDSKIEDFPFWILDKGKEIIVADKKRI